MTSKLIYFFASVVGLMFVCPANAIDPRCVQAQVWTSGYGSCQSCNYVPPEGSWRSTFAYKNRYYFLCDPCNTFCTTIPQRVGTNEVQDSPAQCVAQPMDNQILAASLMFGIDLKETPNEVTLLANNSPELALLLLTYGIVDGEIPEVDQKRHHAISSAFPSTEMVMAAFEGHEESSLGDFKSKALPHNTSLLLESRAILLPNDRASMTLTSRLVTPADHVVLEKLKEVTIELELARPEKLKVMNYNDFEGSAYRIVSIAIE